MTPGRFFPNVRVMTHSTMRCARILKIAGTATGALLALTVTAGCNDPVSPPQQQQQQEQQDEGRDPQDDQHEGDEQDGDQQDGGDKDGGGDEQDDD